MDVKNILVWCVIGLAAGFLASIFVGGGGLVRYLITGLIGAFVGGFLVSATGINIDLGNQWVNQIVIAAIGAIVVVVIARILA
ncbi:GlsB/YeaQ/YmgE family stress response membrane protein [Roseibium algae]|uniref:GlsB/YeaQ/YmgE family stress response membrane protein n=1 Tax=Roseibium algae TaxID=3123038 RepID=A0ABU8TRI9_9HYPH